MDRQAQYDEDFYAWSQQQADVLRSMAARRRDLPNELDLEHVAEEIEDVGKSELKGVISHLRQMLVHAIKLASSPESEAVAGWKTEVIDHQALARDRFTNAMRKDIDLDDLWRRSCREAGKKLAVYGEAMAPMADESPLTLDELLDEELDAEDLVRRLGNA
ncbi:MAG TPA: DUF29 domain-containing protein [Azospirillum sp.]|nr:DUF29 domain-containing protein [Azospirillum sp.]